MNDFLSPSCVKFCQSNNVICSSVLFFVLLVDFYGNYRCTLQLIQYVKLLVSVVAGKTEPVDGPLA